MTAQALSDVADEWRDMERGLAQRVTATRPDLIGAGASYGEALTGFKWVVRTPAPGQRWVPFAWIVLGLIGTGVQLGITGRKR